MGNPLLSEWVLSPSHPDVLRPFRRRSPADSAVGPFRSAWAPARRHPYASGDIGATRFSDQLASTGTMAVWMGTPVTIASRSVMYTSTSLRMPKSPGR